jgi:phage shock protein A
MTLEDFVHSVETRLFGLGRLFWPADPRAHVYDAVERTEVQLRARRAALADARGREEEVRRRLKDRRAAMDLLAAQVESAWSSGESDRAWRLALELDRVRQQLAKDEKELPPLEQLTWSLGFAVRQLERERSRLEGRTRA